MMRLLIFCTALALAARALDLPTVSLAAVPWSCSEGVTLADGVLSLDGDPTGYRRATLTLPGEALAGRTFRFSVQALTQGMTQAKEVAYASPKLKIINQATNAVMAVNNFGTQERPQWTPVVVEVSVPKGHTAPITLEIGLQFCCGQFRAKDVSFVEVQPWRWRVLDGDHKSYFDK
jgi:hypothetical protein